MPFTLPLLPYANEALEPFIDTTTMDIHRTKHHQAYVDKLNAALTDYPELQNKAVEALLTDLSTIPEKVRPAIKNHGGGHLNHSLFWTSMGPQTPKEPVGELLKAIDTNFGDFATFRQAFTDAATAHFASGWVWLSLTPTKKLKIYSLGNQDSPLSQGDKPLLGLDVWEHAYYLKYQNRRPDYIYAWWNVINWPEINKRFLGSGK